jgi:hypothetical protein
MTMIAAPAGLRVDVLAEADELDIQMVQLVQC